MFNLRQSFLFHLVFNNFKRVRVVSEEFSSSPDQYVRFKIIIFIKVNLEYQYPLKMMSMFKGIIALLTNVLRTHFDLMVCT